MRPTEAGQQYRPRRRSIARRSSNRDLSLLDGVRDLDKRIDIQHFMRAVPDGRKRLAFYLYMDKVPFGSTRGNSIARALGVSAKTAKEWVEEVQEILEVGHRNSRTSKGKLGRQHMNQQNRKEERDEVLFAFHQACERPTAEQIITWIERYPQFAEDIRVHAAIGRDSRAGAPAAEADETMFARAYSNALNALYQAEIEASSAAPQHAGRQGSRSGRRTGRDCT